MLEQTSILSRETVCKIDSTLLHSQDKCHLLFLGWLSKHTLSARHDKVPNALDDAVENIHMKLYPEHHEKKKRG
jgi:hypothetical protein